MGKKVIGTAGQLGHRRTHELAKGRPPCSLLTRPA